MGRTVLAEDNLKESIEYFYGNFKWQIGLLIGQLTQQKDFIVHLARTPDPVEDEAEIESCQGEENIPPKEESKKKKKKPTVSDAEEINEKWVAEHARQVNRMLPGGIHIIGIYIFSSPDLVNKNQGKLRQCINVVHKITEKSKAIRNSIPHSDRILLHICASTRKYLFSTWKSSMT